MRKIKFFTILLICLSCTKEGFVSDTVGGQNVVANGCEGVNYPNWETSKNVLPYPVGQSYRIGLSHCSGATHIEGEPDQFAIDFNMAIGTLVTAVRKGTIMFVEESGEDYEELNNMVVLRDEDGYFHMYQHLTENGALVEVNDLVEKGDPIGLSGASGQANNPHLHFVTSRFGQWMPPNYTSYPITFSNTSANPFSLIEGQTYTALPYEGD